MAKNEALFDPKLTYGSPIVLAVAFIFVFLLGIFFIWAINNATDEIGPNLAAFRDKDAKAQEAVYTQGAWAAGHGCLIATVQAENAAALADAKTTAAAKTTALVTKYSDASKLQDLNAKVASCVNKSIPASWGGSGWVSITTEGTGDFSVQTVAGLLTQ